MDYLQKLILFSLVVFLFACSPKVQDKVVETKKDPEPVIKKDTIPLDSLIAWMGPPLPPPPPPPPHIVVSIQRTYCYGKCPEYTAEFYSDGQVLYKGQRNVERRGDWEAQVDTATYQKIIDRAIQINYFKLKKKYPSYGPIMNDFPTTVTYVRDGENDVIIRNRHGSPVSLQRFERYIDTVLDALKWEKYVKKEEKEEGK